MKIAVIFPKDSEAVFNTESNRTFGGATVQMYLFAKELNNYKEKGISTYSFIADYKKISFDEEDFFNLVKTYKENDPSLIKYFKFLKKLYEVKPDIVIQHGLTIFSCVLSVFCKIFGIKFVFMFAHDREAVGCYQGSNKKCSLFKTLLKNSHLLTVQNDSQLEKIPEIFKSKTKIIKNGFEISELCEDEKSYALWVARNDKFKRPELLLALAKLNADLKFVMICPKIPSCSNKDYDILKNNAKKLGNLEFIDIVSFDKINEFFKKAKFFINTSESEGFPQTFIQAAINGVPILSLLVDPDNFLSNFNCGFSFNNDLEKLSNKILELSGNEAEYNELSKNIYKYALDNHNIKNVVKNLLNCFGYERPTHN